MGKKKGHDFPRGRCEICGDTERLSIAECTCGAVLTVCEECYSQRESAEGGGLLEECPECEAEEVEAED
jgi:ribosome-binding protein aMBF1 (putative translation factor)